MPTMRYVFVKGLRVRIMNQEGVTNRIAAIRRQQAAKLKEVLSIIVSSPLYFQCPARQRLAILLKIF